jgi:hypothetical protein
MVESKFLRNVHMASYPTAAGVPAAVGHDIRGDANGRQYWLADGARFLYKGPSPCRRPLTPPSEPSAFNPSEHV